MRGGVTCGVTITYGRCLDRSCIALANPGEFKFQKGRFRQVLLTIVSNC
jgi:hypothetical protein